MSIRSVSPPAQWLALGPPEDSEPPLPQGHFPGINHRVLGAMPTGSLGAVGTQRKIQSLAQTWGTREGFLEEGTSQLSPKGCGGIQHKRREEMKVWGSVKGP